MIFQVRKLNVEKTKAIWLGSWRFNDSKPFGLRWTKEPVRALGTFISYNMKENNKIFGRHAIFLYLESASLWNVWSLHTWYTRSASLLVIPNTYIPKIKNFVFNFIWNKKQHKIKRDVMYQDYSNGGLRAPNVEVLFKSLQGSLDLWSGTLIFQKLGNQFQTISLVNMVVLISYFAVIMTRNS